MKYLVFLLALPVFSQVVTIDAGSPGDRGFTGGAAYGAAQQADLARQVAPFNTLRYGQNFTYELSVPVGTCNVTLSFLENRAAGSLASQSAIGTRVFTVTTPTTSTTIDIFAAAGAQTPYALSLPPIPTPDGRLRIQFAATKGNASVSGISADCTAAPPPPPAIDCVLPLICELDPATQRFKIRIGTMSLVGIDAP